jgi:hypothetical protein
MLCSNRSENGHLKTCLHFQQKMDCGLEGPEVGGSAKR